MSKVIFITGTDTEVGKTYVTCGFLQLAKRLGLVTAALKPIASGASLTAQGLRNSDALLLQENSVLQQDYATVNPFCFAPPIAPHLAAAKVGMRLSVETLKQQCKLNPAAQITFIEGAGGWLLPLNESETYADFVGAEGWSVVLVVGMKLGCLNHALLTVKAITAAGVNLIGWVANSVEQSLAESQNIFSSLKQMIKQPCLGKIEFNALAQDSLSVP